MKLKIGVFFGGKSVEHEVSVISALQTIEAIDQNKYEVVPFYISKDGIFFTGRTLLQLENYKDINGLLSKCKKILISHHSDDCSIINYPPNIFRKNILSKIDVAFPVTHGTHGEDGSLQGLFELMNIPYVGCNVTSSAIGMDKIMMKNIVKASDLPTLNCIWFYSKEWLKERQKLIDKIENEFNYPVIIKPASLGSSVGVTRASNREEFEAAVDLAKMFSNRILVEKLIVNLKEVNCSVLGDYENVERSVCEEPLSNTEILTYQDKYVSKSSTKGMSGAKRKIPADISAELSNLIQNLAEQTFLALNCCGVGRIDFLIDKDTNKVYINEINTIPGSLSFYLWEATGKSFTELTTQLIELALKRYREKNNLIFSHDVNILTLGGK